MAVISDDGGEIFEGGFGVLRRKRSIKQEFTPADNSKYNGVAKRTLALNNDAALAVRIQAPVIYPGVPANPSMWVEVVSWAACHVLNRTATTETFGDKSPYEICYGSPPPPLRGVAVPQASHFFSFFFL